MYGRSGVVRGGVKWGFRMKWAVCCILHDMIRRNMCLMLGFRGGITCLNTRIGVSPTLHQGRVVPDVVVPSHESGGKIQLYVGGMIGIRYAAGPPHHE